MKTKTFIAILGIIFAVTVMGQTAFADQPKKETAVFTVQPKMHCQNCENKIKTNLRFEKGVSDVTTDVKNNTVTVVYDNKKTDIEKLKTAFGKIGYKAEEQKKDNQ